MMLAAALPAMLRAQVQVVGVRDLAFGLVIAGVPTTVSPGDPTRSGEFTVDAPRGSRISVSFALPAGLTGPPGASLPISFTNRDALATGLGRGAQAFDPRRSRTFRFPRAGVMTLYLGGTASPSTGQAPGAYMAPVILNVIVF